MTPYYQDDWLTVYHGDCRTVMAEMEAESIQAVVTSPPYWGLRDYGDPGQLGLESTPEEYVANMVAVFREVRRVLRADGTVWLNLGDSYASDLKGSGGNGSTSTLGITGHAQSADGTKRSGDRQRTEPHRVAHGLKPKDLVGIPWRVAFALQADGWYLRSEIIWAKPNPMPESVTDRPTKSHETIFLLSKSPRYYFDSDAVREGLYDVPRDAAAVSIPRSAESPRRVVAMPAMFGDSDDGMEGASGIYRENPRGQSQVRQDREGQGDQAQARYIGPQTSPGSSLPTDAGGSRGQSTGEHESLWASSSGSVLRPSSDGNGAAVNIDGGAVVGDPGDAIGDVRVLRADDEVDDGSRDPVEQGWSTYGGERGRSVQAVQQPEARPTGTGRNLRSVWTIATAPYPGAHFATFPPKLVEPCIKAGCPEGGTVLDPFAGSGTTGMVAQSLSRRAVLIDLSLDYLGQLMDRNAEIPLGLGA